jgi:hypothetical protein
MPAVRLFERRSFLQGSASVVAAGAALPSFARGGFFAAGSDRIRVGLVGCGGRGTGAAIEAAGRDRGVVVAAIGDLAAAAVDETAGILARRLGDAFDAPADRRFAGRDACELVCDAGIDVVILAASAGVRPEHVAAAVARGLHVYAERPLAVDQRGLAEVAASGRSSAARGLSFVTSLSLRYDPDVAVAIDRVRSLDRRVHEIEAVELSGGLVAERCLDAADAALAALGGHGDEWSAHSTSGGVSLRAADGRCIRVLLDASPSRHGRMVARHSGGSHAGGSHAGGSVEFVSPAARRRATASGLSAAWAALLESIRRGRPINDSQEACRAGAVMLSAAVVCAARRPAERFSAFLPETA